MSETTENCCDSCEDILRDNIRYNTRKKILPSENAVAEQLLVHGDELAEAYEELHKKLHRQPYALQKFMGMLLSAQAHWSPEKIAKARNGRESLEQVNAKIAKQARALAALLDQRTELHNMSGFSSGTLYHICDVIEQASTDNGHYMSFLHKPLLNLSGQYDLKYWPPLSRCLLAIVEDAAKAKLEATDPLTEAATASNRPSTSDSVMAFFAYIEDCRGDYPGALPRRFQVSDKHMATLMNILLGLPVEKLLTAEYIKGRRQKMRGLIAQKGRNSAWLR